MQSQSHLRALLLRIRTLAVVAPMCAAICVGTSAPAAAVVTTGPTAPTIASKSEPQPAPSPNILPLALPLILAQDAHASREEQNAGEPHLHRRTFVPLTFSQEISPSAIALAGLGVVTLAGGTAFAAVARRRT